MGCVLEAINNTPCDQREYFKLESFVILIIDSLEFENFKLISHSAMNKTLLKRMAQQEEAKSFELLLMKISIKNPG